MPCDFYPNHLNMEINETNQKLTSEEQNRLDQTLSEARGFHNRSFALAFISLIIAVIEPRGEFVFAYQSLNLPKIHTVVGLYFGVIILTFLCAKFFLRAIPFINLDDRRLTFPWIVIGIRMEGLPMLLSFFWISLPLLICCFATSLSLKSSDKTGIFLTFAGLMIVAFPWYIDKKLNLISTKSDERGGAATFSIYLLYWLRLLRSVVIGLSIAVPILSIIPNFREALSWLVVPGAIIALLLALRIIGTIPFIYRMLDRLGTRFGFPPKSEHY